MLTSTWIRSGRGLDLGREGRAACTERALRGSNRVTEAPCGASDAFFEDVGRQGGNSYVGMLRSCAVWKVKSEPQQQAKCIESVSDVLEIVKLLASVGETMAPR